MVMKIKKEAPGSTDQACSEMLTLLGEPGASQRWVAARQHKAWRPPTDVYETDESVVVKVEVAGMQDEDFEIALDGKRLIISGIRRDPASKLGYQQMEIPYGHFETDVYLARAIDEEKIEATYQNGFLVVHLPKAKPRTVPVTNVESTS
jgi:HSP20 family protein